MQECAARKLHDIPLPGVVSNSIADWRAPNQGACCTAEIQSSQCRLWVKTGGYRTATLSSASPRLADKTDSQFYRCCRWPSGLAFRRLAGFPIDGLDRFASTSSSPLAIHETHGRNLIFPSDSLFLRCRERRHSIGATPGQQCPGDARHLVGERNGHDLERSPCQELRQPRIFLRALLGPPQHGMRPDHKNTPQIAVTLFRDRSKLLFAPG